MNGRGRRDIYASPLASAHAGGGGRGASAGVCERGLARSACRDAAAPGVPPLCSHARGFVSDGYTSVWSV